MTRDNDTIENVHYLAQQLASHEAKVKSCERLLARKLADATLHPNDAGMRHRVIEVYRADLNKAHSMLELSRYCAERLK